MERGRSSSAVADPVQMPSLVFGKLPEKRNVREPIPCRPHVRTTIALRKKASLAWFQKSNLLPLSGLQEKFR